MVCETRRGSGELACMITFVSAIASDAQPREAGRQAALRALTA